MFTEVVRSALAYDGSAPIRVEVKALRRGVIRRIQVLQTAGTEAGYTCALYNRREACPPDGSAPAADRDLYRISRVYTVAADAAALADADAYDIFGIAYSNADAGSTNALASLYLEIVPAGGTATSRFALALCIEAAIVN